MNTPIVSKLHSLLRVELSANDKAHVAALVDLFAAPDIQSDERQPGGLSVREKYAVAHFRALSEPARKLVDCALEAAVR